MRLYKLVLIVVNLSPDKLLFYFSTQCMQNNALWLILQNDNSLLDEEKGSNADDESEDGEEKKDQEKLPEDIMEKPSVVRCFCCLVFLRPDTLSQDVLWSHSWF